MNTELREIYALIQRLRAPDGCPWDRAQTLQSLKMNLVSEAYEVLDAIERGQNPAEELGDVLLVLLLMTAIGQEKGEFDLRDVLGSLKKKVIERHPHVFGSQKVSDQQEVLRNWERSKPSSGEFPDGVNTNQPSLMLADELGRKAKRLGFDWEDVASVFEKLKEEISELERALEGQGDPRHELGDLLFAAAMLARHIGTTGEDVLREADKRFILRFKTMRRMARDQGKDLQEMSLQEMEDLWQRAKHLLKTE